MATSGHSINAIDETTPLISSDEHFENEIWRNSFYSTKRVRHVSERNARVEYYDSSLQWPEDSFSYDVESLNYDAEWKIELELQKSQTRQFRKRRRKKGSTGCREVFYARLKRKFTDSSEFLRGIICTMVGVLTAMTHIFLAFVTDRIVVSKHNLFVLVTENATHHPYLHSLIIPGWVILNVLIATIGSIIVYLLEPRTFGSGVPELRTIINGVEVPRGVNFRSFVARLVGMIITPTAELPLGRSEPLMYVGGAIAGGVSQGMTSTCPLMNCNIFKKLRNHAEKRDFMTAGAAAGFCAAFGTPLAAVLFMMEQMSTHWKQAGVWRVLWTSIVTSMSVITVSTFWQPQESVIGTTIFGVIPQVEMSLMECVVAVFIGIIGGLLGVLFRVLNRGMNRVRACYSSRQFRILEVMMLSIGSVCCLLPLLWVEGKKHCRTMNEGNMVTPVGASCPEGQFNSLGMLVLQLPTKTFQSLVHEPADTFYPLSTFLFACYWFFACAVMYGCNLPGGVLMPNLIIGAAWGRLLGLLAAEIFPPSPVISVDKLALLGAASQTAGLLRVFLTIPMVFVESTQSIGVGIVIAVAVLAANTTAVVISSTDFYTMWTRLLQFAYLPMEADDSAQHFMALRRLRASDVMSCPVTFVRTTEKVEDLLTILRETPHNGFPVVSPTYSEGTCGKLRGFIDRTTLLALLEHKELYSQDVMADTEHLGTETFRRPSTASLATIDNEMLEDEMSRRIVIADYMSIAPHVAQMHMSFMRAYTMFRTLGLRHLPVVTAHNEVVGIITRKDLLRFRWKSYLLMCRDDSISGELIECSFVKRQDNEDW